MGTALCAFITINTAHADPTFSGPSSGSIPATAIISGPGAHITQTSIRAVIDWSGFNSGSRETVTFKDPVAHVPNVSNAGFNDSHLSPSAGGNSKVDTNLSPVDSANDALNKLGLLSQ